MRYDDVAIPLSGSWTSPFVKWQGALAETSSLDVAAAVTVRALAGRQEPHARGAGSCGAGRPGGGRAANGPDRRGDHAQPFAVNDLYFAKHTGFPVERMKAYGCSLIFGHPQGPTGLRSITELIEELRLRGGGTGVFTGCAAGDSGAAVVVRVED